MILFSNFPTFQTLLQTVPKRKLNLNILHQNMSFTNTSKFQTFYEHFKSPLHFYLFLLTKLNFSLIFSLLNDECFHYFFTVRSKLYKRVPSSSNPKFKFCSIYVYIWQYASFNNKTISWVLYLDRCSM